MSAAAARYKQQAAEQAVAQVESGMAVGLGTGSTAIFATQRIGQLLRAGALRDVVGFPTSRATAEAARALGIPLLDESLPRALDLTIDGADEVDPQLNLIKGGGGAMFREKVAAEASRRLIVVVDASKLVAQLGARFAVPVEVTHFGWQAQRRYLESLGATITLRQQGDAPFVTDQGNLVLDCAFGPIDDPAALAARIDARAGILEHGLFVGRASEVVVAGVDGVRVLSKRGNEGMRQR